MILDLIRDNLDGDSWEKWCDACYRDTIVWDLKKLLGVAAKKH